MARWRRRAGCPESAEFAAAEPRAPTAPVQPLMRHVVKVPQLDLVVLEPGPPELPGQVLGGVLQHVSVPRTPGRSKWSKSGVPGPDRRRCEGVQVGVEHSSSPPGRRSARRRESATWLGTGRCSITSRRRSRRTSARAAGLRGRGSMRRRRCRAPVGRRSSCPRGRRRNRVLPEGQREVGELAATDVEHLEPAPRRPLREAPQHRRVPGPVPRVIRRLLLPTVRGHQPPKAMIEGGLVEEAHRQPRPAWSAAASAARRTSSGVRTWRRSSPPRRPGPRGRIPPRLAGPAVEAQ